MLPGQAHSVARASLVIALCALLEFARRLGRGSAPSGSAAYRSGGSGARFSCRLDSSRNASLGTQRDAALVGSDKWLELFHMQRPGNLAELILDKARVHRTHDRVALSAQQVVKRAGLNGYAEPVFVKNRFESHVVKVCEQRVDLPLAFSIKRRAALSRGIQSPKQVSGRLRVMRTPIGSRVDPRLLHRVKDHGWSTTNTRRNRATHDEAFFFKQMQVLTRGVDVNSRGFGELLELSSRDLLHGVQEPNPACLFQASIVFNPARHTLILGGSACRFNCEAAR